MKNNKRGTAISALAAVAITGCNNVSWVETVVSGYGGDNSKDHMAVVRTFSGGVQVYAGRPDNLRFLRDDGNTYAFPDQCTGTWMIVPKRDSMISIGDDTGCDKLKGKTNKGNAPTP